MAQTYVWPQYNFVVWIHAKTQWMCGKSVWWQRPTLDRQPFLRKTATSFKSITQFRLSRNGTYDRIVAHLGRELEVIGSEKDGELSIPTMTAVPTNDYQQNTEQSKIFCHYFEEPGHVNWKDSRFDFFAGKTAFPTVSYQKNSGVNFHCYIGSFLVF